MNIWVIIGMAVIVIAIIFLSRRSTDEEGARKSYMETMASFFDVPLQTPNADMDSYKIQFDYKGRNFIFEDIENRPLANEVFRDGILKTKTSSTLILHFVEKSRSSIRTDIRTIKDLKYGWAQASKDILMPKGLEEFNVFTNNVPLTIKLLGDDKVVNFYKSIKCRGNRGHPVIALEISDGLIQLKFQGTKSDLKPNLLDLQYNATLIEEYVKNLHGLASRIDSLQQETELSGQ